MSTNTFTFSGKAKTYLLGMIIGGVALILLGMFTFGGGHGEGHGDGHNAHGQMEQVQHAKDKLHDAAEDAKTATHDAVDHAEAAAQKGEAAVKDALNHAKDHAEEGVEHAKEGLKHAEENVHNAVEHAKEVVEGHGDSHGHQSGHDAHGHDDGHTEAGHGTHGDAHGAKSHDSHGEDHGAHAGGHGDAHGGHGDAHGGHGAHGEHHAVAGSTPISAKKALWLNLWVIVQMLMWMSFAAMFFLAAHTAGWAGWHVLIQKVLLAVMTILPVAIFLGAIVFALGHKDIFIWTNPEAMEHSALMATKKAFLNVKAFAVLGAFWSIISVFLLSRWWSILKSQDENPDLKFFSKSRTLAAVTIVLVAIINAFGVWHWIMSIEPNWYSTLYAWYTMASGACIMVASTILTLLFLQSQGLLPQVNENHYHDLGKYLFAASVFWTYLWFSQYMLIWYGNIPEETIYFKERMANYPVLFYGALILNFFFAFLVLIMRDAKRNRGIMILASIVIIIGHWFDFFNMIVPFGMHKGGMSLISVGCLFVFFGIAGFVILTALTRVKSLDSSNHPYYKESVKHHI